MTIHSSRTASRTGLIHASILQSRNSRTLADLNHAHGTRRSRSRAAAASEYAPGARCFTRDPYGAAGGRRKVRRMARRMRASFSPAHGGAVEKPRSPPAHPEGRMPGGRAIGVSFSLGYFSFWTSKREVARAPAGARNRFVSSQDARAERPLPQPLSHKWARGVQHATTPTRVRRFIRNPSPLR